MLLKINMQTEGLKKGGGSNSVPQAPVSTGRLNNTVNFLYKNGNSQIDNTICKYNFNHKEHFSEPIADCSGKTDDSLIDFD